MSKSPQLLNLLTWRDHSLTWHKVRNWIFSPIHSPSCQWGWTTQTNRLQKGWFDTLTSLIWLVVGPPLWKIWTSIGMIVPNIWENKKWQPNHQPVIIRHPKLWQTFTRTHKYDPRLLPPLTNFGMLCYWWSYIAMIHFRSQNTILHFAYKWGVIIQNTILFRPESWW